MKPDHERIWLQPGAGDCGETTWCQDRIHDDDIEYIRADIHARALLEAHQRGRREGMEEAAEVAREMLVYADTTSEADVAIPAAIRAKAQEVGQ